MSTFEASLYTTLHWSVASDIKHYIYLETPRKVNLFWKIELLVSFSLIKSYNTGIKLVD